jgi:hypothetical protein
VTAAGDGIILPQLAEQKRRLGNFSRTNSGLFQFCTSSESGIYIRSQWRPSGTTYYHLVIPVQDFSYCVPVSCQRKSVEQPKQIRTNFYRVFFSTLPSENHGPSMSYIHPIYIPTNAPSITSLSIDRCQYVCTFSNFADKCISPVISSLSRQLCCRSVHPARRNFGSGICLKPRRPVLGAFGRTQECNSNMQDFADLVGERRRRASCSSTYEQILACLYLSSVSILSFNRRESSGLCEKFDQH